MPDLDPSQILQQLEKKGYSSSAIERMLGLAQGTLDTWKTGDLDKESQALLQMLVTFPWILDVAENGFKNANIHLIHALLRQAQVEALETAADCINLHTMGNSVGVVRARNVLYKLRDALDSPRARMGGI